MGSAQGDRAILDILSAFGARVKQAGGDILVARGELRPLNVDAREIPDLVPVVSALLCAAQGQSRIINAARLRLKESDRLKTTCAMLAALGAGITETGDGLLIGGTASLRGGETDSYNDHRIAMAASVAAALCENDVTIKGAQCVSKSYPDFFEDLNRLEKRT